MESVVAKDGVKIAYRYRGEGRLPVFLIHGWAMSGAVFDDVITHLDCKHQRFIVPDLRGAGGSDKPESNYTFENYAADVLAVADHLGIERFVVVGHSMGGQIAQWLAAFHAERILGVVLVCPASAAGFHVDEEAKNSLANAGGNREVLRAIMQSVCQNPAPTVLEKLLADSMRTAPIAARESFHTSRQGGFSHALVEIRAPTLVIATDDPFISPHVLEAEIVSKISGAQMAILPGPGHYAPVERPHETAALLTAFFAALRVDQD